MTGALSKEVTFDYYQKDEKQKNVFMVEGTKDTESETGRKLTRKNLN